MVGLMKLKLNTAQQSALKLVEDRLHLVGLDWIIITKNWLVKYFHGCELGEGWWAVGGSGLKANIGEEEKEWEKRESRTFCKPYIDSQIMIML